MSKGIDWFERNVVMPVPFPHGGFGRKVYPGFLQLGGFMGMNLDRHVNAHNEFFNHLISGDGDSAEKHRDFYDEYLAVMDLTEEFYLQTVEAVFIAHSLPEGTFTYRGRTIDCSRITKTALMTIEGEKDDITGSGQTEAAHVLCSNIPEDMHCHYEQPGVGHYGVFNGSRFRSEIAPRIGDFMRSNDLFLKCDAERAAVKTQVRKQTEKRAQKQAVAKKDKTEAVSKPPKSAGKHKAKPAPTKAAAAPVADKPDDLKRIKGIGPAIEARLNKMDITSFAQIAAWSQSDIDTISQSLSFKGRIERENWIEQAGTLAKD